MGNKQLCWWWWVLACDSVLSRFLRMYFAEPDGRHAENHPQRKPEKTRRNCVRKIDQEICFFFFLQFKKGTKKKKTNFFYVKSDLSLSIFRSILCVLFLISRMGRKSASIIFRAIAILWLAEEKKKEKIEADREKGISE